MARFGRTTPQRRFSYGYPPGTAPGAAPPTPPVAGGLSITGGGRRGRGSRIRPQTHYPLRAFTPTAVVFTDTGTVALALTLTGAEANTRADVGTVAFKLTPTASESHAHTSQATLALALLLTATEQYVVGFDPGVFVHGSGVATAHFKPIATAGDRAMPKGIANHHSKPIGASTGHLKPQAAATGHAKPKGGASDHAKPSANPSVRP